MEDHQNLEKFRARSFREVSRLLTVVENSLPGAESILKSLKIDQNIRVIGITGPPGAGKSTLISGMIDLLVKQNKRIAVLAVDPTSPFTSGSLLGDRIRMQRFSTHENVYIRSVATRGSLGGLSAKIIEMTDVLKSSGFDYIIVETVGVGQSEVEIASLANLTLVVLVPESGDEIQSLKSGLMEIADVFIINKADRPGADILAKNLSAFVNLKGLKIFKTIATTAEGIAEIIAFADIFKSTNEKQLALLSQKAWNLIQEKRMADIEKKTLEKEIAASIKIKDFNLYNFVASKIKNS